MEESLADIIVLEFNSKLSYAVLLALKYGIYGNVEPRYKFMVAAYVCVSFTVTSFDTTSADWMDMFDCTEPTDYAAEMSLRDLDDRYDPTTKGADYLAVIKIVFSGDNSTDIQQRIDDVQTLLDDDPLNDTASVVDTESDPGTLFRRYVEQCMTTNASFEAMLPKYESCDGFLGLNLPSFSIVSQV